MSQKEERKDGPGQIPPHVLTNCSVLHAPGRVGRIRGNVSIYKLSKEKNATIKLRGWIIQ